MSYQTFADLASALVAFGAEPKQCRRHVRIDGRVIDLLQAQAEVGRVREEPAVIAPPAPTSIAAAILHDLDVGRNVRAELARAAAPVDLPPLAEPAIPAPPDDASAYRCPWCSRPWEGVK